MKNRFLATGALALSLALSAQTLPETRVFDLTPDVQGEPHAMLEVSLPSAAPAGAVVVCPGGGYAFTCNDKEGRDWIEWFGARNVATAVLIYRLPNGRNEVPLSDCHAAISLLREHAAEWQLPADKIGVMGFSAGGHLASTAATHFTEATRPNFQILFYPVITMEEGVTHQGSREHLIGETPSADLVRLYSNELQVTPNTPPAFITACGDDNIVPIANSLRYYQALSDAKVPAEAAFFPQGGHGYGKMLWFNNIQSTLYLLDHWLRATLGLPEATTRNIGLIYIGDSISYGYRNGDSREDAPPEKTTRLVAEALGTEANVRGANCGICGYTTADFLPWDKNGYYNTVVENADQLSANDAELIFSVMLGTNDSACDACNGSPLTPQVYASNLKAFLVPLLERYPRSKVLINHPTWYSPNTHNGALYGPEGAARLKTLSAVIPDVVADINVDFPGRVFEGDTEGYAIMRDNYETLIAPEEGYDGTFYLHPNTAGARVLSNLWAKHILHLLQ